MRIVRFSYRGKEEWGVLKGKKIFCLKGAPLNGIRITRRTIPQEKVVLLPPCKPSKIMLLGLNYRDHAREMQMPLPEEPVIFLKPPSAVIGHLQDIVYPRGVSRLDYEAELALVIKKKGKDIPVEKIDDYILGYTCLNDVTARDLQKKDGQWTRSKSFDTFCPIGPWVETEADPHNLRVRAWVNNKIKQNSSTAQFIFPLAYVVSFISRIMTLMPGDVISTGTPCGIGPLKRGDIVKVGIEEIGSLVNKII